MEKIDMKHGGDIAGAGARFGNPDRPWLDLSTGIAPSSYRFAPLSPESWHRLPQSDALGGLLIAARRAYGADKNAPIIAAPGTQCLIQALPRLRAGADVAILTPTYSEHAASWLREGHSVVDAGSLQEAGNAEVVVVVNPNNPDGRVIAPTDLMATAEALANRGGLLVVDEAFADLTPDMSVCPSAGVPGLLILRSFGKFYGLAGLRLGFALGHGDDIAVLSDLLGPWAVPGPAIEIGAQALTDNAWADAARTRYAEAAGRLDQLLTDAGLKVIGGTALFRLAEHPTAAKSAEALARAGILVRVFEDRPTWLRFGLPDSDADFEWLAATMANAGVAQ